MWRALGLVAVLLLASGCASTPEETTSPGTSASPVYLEMDFITPRTWDGRGDTEHMMAWVHNLGAAQTSGTWSLTGEGGAPLPAAWNVTFDPPMARLEPFGTKVPSGQRLSYPDWARTHIVLRLPPGEPAGNHSIELHFGPQTQDGTLVVHDNRGRVAGPGSEVWVDTVGSFSSTGQVFWQSQPGNPFHTTLGTNEAVEGVSFGLMGVTAGETVALYVPPAFAYGYDNPQPSQPNEQDYSMFNGHTLVFTMRMTRFL